MANNNLRKISILSIALVLTSSYAISAIVTFLQNDYLISRIFAESLISLPSLFILLMTVLSEPITRKIGLKSCVILGLSLIFISGIIPILIKNLASIIISRITLGVGIGLFCSHSANYINLFYKDYEKEKLQGIRNSMEYTGQIFLLILAGFLIKYNWIYSFLIYTFSIFILILFYKNIEDVRFENKKDKIKLNKNVLVYMGISFFCIMNITAMTIRFAPIAEINLGKNANVSLYLSLIPLVGMISGLFYGKIYEILKNNTVILGLFIYTVTNIIISFSESDFYLFLSSTLVVTIAQSMVMPFMFSNASRLVDEASKRVATNMMFVACNLGAFSASYVINTFSIIIRSQSLTYGFLIFSVFSSILILLFKKI